MTAIQSTARYWCAGLATIVNAINPECIYLDGEITTAWDLIGSDSQSSFDERGPDGQGPRAPRCGSPSKRNIHGCASGSAHRSTNLCGATSLP